ncbi:MAG: hypothetical protein ABIR00_08555 [Nitrosospira sp.]
MNVDNVDYKGYKFVASAEQDDTTGLWNGRYKRFWITTASLYESFATALNEEGKTQEAANAEARAWIDGDAAKLSGTTE